MSMLEWAREEVRLACERENPDRKEGEFDYGCACYESALKAFESLCNDCHSGFSIGITKAILMRLIDGNPLSPIEDTEDVWNDITAYTDEDKTSFQCKRKSSLFKDVYKDGTVKYKDVDRVYCYDVDTGCTSSFSLVTRLIDEMYPITMPYYPGKSWKVETEDFLTDKRNGDFDTVGVLRLIKEGETIEINRFFKADTFLNENSFVEISKEAYEERKNNKIEN